jgi:hypothetical protein
MKNLAYLLWAYALIALLVSVYGASLVIRARRVARELETLAEAIRARRGGKNPPAA